MPTQFHLVGFVGKTALSAYLHGLLAVAQVSNGL